MTFPQGQTVAVKLATHTSEARLLFFLALGHGSVPGGQRDKQSADTLHAFVRLPSGQGRVFRLDQLSHVTHVLGLPGA